MRHGFLPGGIQPGGGLALTVLVLLCLSFTSKKGGLTSLSPVFLNDLLMKCFNKKQENLR